MLQFFGLRKHVFLKWVSCGTYLKYWNAQSEHVPPHEFRGTFSMFVSWPPSIIWHWQKFCCNYFDFKPQDDWTTLSSRRSEKALQIVCEQFRSNNFHNAFEGLFFKTQNIQTLHQALWRYMFTSGTLTHYTQGQWGFRYRGSVTPGGSVASPPGIKNPGNRTPHCPCVYAFRPMRAKRFDGL